MIRIFAVLLALVTLFTASPAHAGPLAALVPIVIGAVVKSAIVKLALTLAASVALSALSKQKKARSPGIMIEATLTGGTNARTGIFGLYCTAGSMAAPAYSYGSAGKTPNVTLVKIIALADVPTHAISRIIIAGEYVNLNRVGSTNVYNFTGKYAGKGSVTFYDGRQVVADPSLVAVLASYPNRPWNNSRVGIGVTYAIFRYTYDPEIYKQEPDVRVELYGMRLYDFRKDSTAGGSGSHRWGQPATYEITHNPAVMIYNILRGIELPGGAVFGGEATADDLPVANWAAAMNVCDELVGTTTGNEARYRAGYEFSLDEEPADVIEELMKAASAQIVENGGVYKIRIGPPSMPVMFITDDDFLVTKEQELDPFPGIAVAKNTVRAVFPHPGELWQQHDAPQVQPPEYLERDGGTELVSDLQFPACPYPLQVQRNMLAWLQDDQRWRRHTGTLSHRAFALEPLDTIAWTSARNGYIEKWFEVGLEAVSLYNLTVAPALREVDPDDYDWSSDDELPDPVTPGGWELPETQAVPGFNAVAWTVKDADADHRRPAIRCTWDIEGAIDAEALRIEVRVAATGEAVTSATVANVDVAEHLISEGILPSTSYEVRAQYKVDRPTEWTIWHGLTTGDVRLGEKDLDFDEIIEGLGPSILLPSLTRPGRTAMIQQIIDAAHNDYAVRSANQLQIEAFTGVYGNVAALRNETLIRLTEDEAIVSVLNVQIARIGTNEAGLVQEAITRASADSALATNITTLFSQSGANSAAISSEAITRAAADSALSGLITTVNARLNNAGGTGVTVEAAFSATASDITGLKGEYTLKINVNGRISGFGLASGPSGSEFAILADRFIVVDPANNSTTAYPFQVVGGVVYIRKAFIQTITSDQITTGEFITLSAQIKDATITTAKIGDLQVDTIKIANNALTVPFYVTAPSVGFTPISGEYTILETSVLSIGSGIGATCLVAFYATARTSGLAGFGPDSACDLKLYIDKQDGSGYVLFGAQSVGIDVNSGSGYFWIPVSLITLSTGVINAKFKVTGTAVSGPNGATATGINIGAPVLVVQGAKK